MASVWVVPGAPLEGGRGWRVWFSWPAGEGFDEPAVEVRRGGSPQRCEKPVWLPFPALAGSTRSMGLLTVELEQPKPHELFEIAFPGIGTFHWRTLPASLDERPVVFLLASCFWLQGDKEGAYRSAVLDLAKDHRPAFKLLLGDQVYQDVPLRRPALNVSRLFAERYESYWSDAYYRDVLGTCPNFFTCDDHEFWNNYPERQFWLPQTWGPLRDASELAARETYRCYQSGLNPGGSPYYRFAVPPVSFFVADARSDRTAIDASPPRFFGDGQRAKLQEWAEGLTGPGVLVLAQPLFDEEGSWKDRSLASFREEFVSLCETLETCVAGSGRPSREPHDVLVLAGDIHTGRLAAGELLRPQGAVRVHELVTSPASRVSARLMGSKPKHVPNKLRVASGSREVQWAISEAPESVTADDNIGLVRMRRWTAGSVRFELELWRIRPRLEGSFWERALRRDPPRGALALHFRRELVLR